MSLIVSPVVRKNLERAFTRSVNKLEWFENLRRLGVSQDFYEYVIEQLKVPVRWLVDDLRSLRVRPTPKIRSFLKDRIQVVVPGEEISTSEIHLALEFLTPLEKQEALVSRFLLVEPPSELMTDDILSLLWDSRESVGVDVINRWSLAISEHLVSKTTLSTVEQKWAEHAWSCSARARDSLSPLQFDELSDLWPQYFEDLASAGHFGRISDCLPRIADEVLKIKWIDILIGVGHLRLVEPAVKSLQNRYSQLKYLAHIHLAREISLSGLSVLAEAMEEAPITLEQIDIAKRIVSLFMRSELLVSARGLEILTAAENILDRYKVDISDERIQLAQKWDLKPNVWALRTRRWHSGSMIQRDIDFSAIVEMTTDPRFYEEGQRLFVDFILGESQASALVDRVLEVLLSETSSLRIKHLRREFIEKATLFDPLRREILRFRAQYDPRSVIVWNCFYEEPLKLVAPSVVHSKRRFLNWKTSSSLCRHGTIPNSLRVYEAQKNEMVGVLEPCEELEKMASKLSVLFGRRRSLKVYLSGAAQKPLSLQFDPDILVLRKSSKYLFDDETLKSFLYGYIQLRSDFDSGLFQSVVLSERFLMGMLLSGVPLLKMIRFLVEVSKEDLIFDQSPETLDPESLIRQAPLIRDFLSFYLSEEFLKMVDDSGILLT